MYLSLLVTLVVALVWAPLESQRIYRAAYDWQLAQIAVDNAAIVVGRKDCDLFDSLVRANKLMDTLEAAHHTAHVCAISAVATAACISADQALENQIRILHESTYRLAFVRWTGNRAEAMRQFSLLGARVKEFDRPAAVPISSVECPICGLETFWEIEQKGVALEYHLCADAAALPKVTVKLSGDTLISGTWNYRMEF